MPFDWENFLNFAKEIQNRNDEAAKRIAISRAYYCVFNKARIYATEKLGYQESMQKDSHETLWRYFESRGRTFKAVRDKGKALKDRRIKADYQDDYDKLDVSLKLAIMEAEAILYYLNQTLQKNP